MTPIITVDKLSKQYRLGARQASYQTVREACMSAVQAPLRWLRGRSGAPAEMLQALQDVSFEVAPGEVVGIIGRNGAGKSTLLKILSRITEPTTGEVVLCGRVGSLLEVGTGFHPELTGRDNIYLNGAILGMSRREIAQKFDEIVAFAEVDRFIDTAVKFYSSGMYMRLAFAVAAHLEPEILIVDEVLAVGDAEFQKKCLGKMGEVAASGRTVLFVSHNMAAVQNLCTKSILLSGGRVACQGSVPDVISHYVSSLDTLSGHDIDLRQHGSRVSRAVPIIHRLRLSGEADRGTDTFPCGGRMAIELSLAPDGVLSQPNIGIGVNDQFGQRLFTVGTYYASDALPELTTGSVVRCEIDELPLAPGRYSLTLAAGTSTDPTRDWLQHAVYFSVIEADYFGCGRFPRSSHGSLLVRSRWTAADGRSAAIPGATVHAP